MIERFCRFSLFSHFRLINHLTINHKMLCRCKVKYLNCTFSIALDFNPMSYDWCINFEFWVEIIRFCYKNLTKVNVILLHLRNIIEVFFSVFNQNLSFTLFQYKWGEMRRFLYLCMYVCVCIMIFSLTQKKFLSFLGIDV